MKTNPKADHLDSLALILKIRRELVLARIDIAEAAGKLSKEKADELRRELK